MLSILSPYCRLLQQVGMLFILPRTADCYSGPVRFPFCPRTADCYSRLVGFPSCPRTADCYSRPVCFPFCPRTAECYSRLVCFPSCPRTADCYSRPVCFPSCSRTKIVPRIPFNVLSDSNLSYTFSLPPARIQNCVLDNVLLFFLLRISFTFSSSSLSYPFPIIITSFFPTYTHFLFFLPSISCVYLL
jgi:hypothetical protein